MYLSRLIIRNFRSIKKLDLNFNESKNVIIGRNNSGKSNIVKALDKVLGSGSPTYSKSENISENDFFSWKDTHAETGEEVSHSEKHLYIFCELIRKSDEQLNWDNIYGCSGFYVLSDGYNGQNKRIGKHSVISDYESIFQSTQDTKGNRYVNPKLRHQQTFENEIGSMYHFGFSFYASKNDEGEVTSKDIRFLYRENPDADWCVAFSAPIRTELLQSAILPSFRDPQNQLRPSKWTWYGKLMLNLTQKHENAGELKKAFEGVRIAADRMFASFTKEVTESSLKIAFPETSLHFQFHADSKHDIHKNCMIYIDDGFKSEISEKGAGIQSATIIGLFKYYTKYVDITGSALLCIEEPEVYLHPHARRVISNRLDEFVEGDNNQVILTTHSVEFCKPTGKETNLVLVRTSKEGTKAQGIPIRQFQKLIIDNNQNELFFADKVIICEGYDEYLIRAISAEMFQGRLDECNVSIVAVGGKDNISELVKLVIRLGIKCFIISDFDYLLRDNSTDCSKYGAKPHRSIMDLGRSFFAQDCICGEKQADSVISKLAKLRNEIKANDEKAFYTAKNKTEIVHNRLEPALAYLRSCGVCVLDAEIENLSKDTSFINTSEKNKLSVQKIYQLHERICNGTKVCDLFETEAICSFLSYVFEK